MDRRQRFELRRNAERRRQEEQDIARSLKARKRDAIERKEASEAVAIWCAAITADNRRRGLQE